MIYDLLYFKFYGYTSGERNLANCQKEINNTNIPKQYTYVRYTVNIRNYGIISLEFLDVVFQNIKHVILANSQQWNGGK